MKYKEITYEELRDILNGGKEVFIRFTLSTGERFETSVLDNNKEKKKLWDLNFYRNFMKVERKYNE